LLVSLIFMAVLALALRRAERNLRLSVQQRVELARHAEDARGLAAAAEQARAALADQHLLMTQLLATTPQGAWFVDTEGRTFDVNAAMCTLLGRPREAVMGRSAYEFFDGADLATLQREVGSRSQGRSSAYEISITRPDGTQRHCQNHATPIHDAQGRYLGSVGLWSDVTPIVEASRALRVHAWAINSITAAVSVISEDGVYRMVNDTWCSATGVAREAVIGRHADEALPGRIMPARRAAAEKCLATQREQMVRVPMELPGLGLRTVETRYFPYGGGGGDDGSRCVVLVSRDVTDEEQALRALQASEAEKKVLVEAFPGFIARLDQDLVYRYVNERFAELMHVKAEEVIGRTPWQLFGPERAQLIAEEGRRTFAGETVVSERRLGGAGWQPEVHIQLTTARGTDPVTGAPVFFAFGTDISGLHRARVAMAEARAEAERANNAKSQFLAHMSHELRTPLNAILGFAQLLATDPELTLNKRRQGFLLQIQRGGEHLLGLINEVLELGRIEAGQLALQTQPVRLDGFADGVLELVRPLAQARRVRLLPLAAGTPLLAVQADPMRLKQVLLNLLGNAIKYNQPGGDVALGWAPHAGGVRISVRDTGRGIAAADQARVFEPFERLRVQSSDVEGTGIGLALSRKLVQAMGGEMGLDSRRGEGSTFWLDLPLAVLPALAIPATDRALGASATASTAAPPNPAARSHRVLYIEDNPVNLMVMEAMLELLPDVEPVCEISAEQGLDLAVRLRPSLILLDMHMPVMDGYEVLRRLRLNPLTRDIPVCAVSANAMRRDIDAALAAGFVAYLTKPIQIETLTDTVRQVLKQRDSEVR
jgi:PAS domain S-box-containing protein